MAGRLSTRSSGKYDDNEVIPTGIVLRNREIPTHDTRPSPDVGSNSRGPRRRPLPTTPLVTTVRSTRSGKHYTSVDIIDEVVMDSTVSDDDDSVSSPTITRRRYSLRNKQITTPIVTTPITDITTTTTVSPEQESDSLYTLSHNDSKDLTMESDGEGAEKSPTSTSDLTRESDSEGAEKSPTSTSDNNKESLLVEGSPHTETQSPVIAGRQKQVKKLQLLMGKCTEWAPPSMFLYGEEAVGKTLVIKSLLPSNCKKPVAYVSLKECYTSRILFESILNSLSGVVPSSSNQYIGYTRCDHLPLFIKELRSLIVDQKWEGQTTYIVLDDFDWILNLEHTVCLSLMKLAELTDLNLCVIAVSRCLWEKYDFPFDTIQLHFPQYSKEEVLEILLDNCPPDISRPFYNEFLNQVWNLVHTITRNIKELKYLCSQLFPIYREPIESGEASEKDSLKLWNHIRPYCQQYLSHTYTRNIINLKNSRQSTVQDASTTPLCSTLPYFSKYLLIASYLSSYNPSKCDQRFFSEKRSKTKRSKGTKKKKGPEMKRQLIGPRPFTVDRMLTIFSSIIGRELIISAPLLTQIPTLVSMGLLAKVSQGDVLDIVRYKCMVTFEVIRDIAKSVDFEIVRFLYDYN